jgi:TolA-binding protein
MYDDAMTQFETVINSYPRGNKVHDSRFMLGRAYSLKGETSRAVEILQSALKNNPPTEVREKILKQLNNIQ